jgi:hypothetical protein
MDEIFIVNSSTCFFFNERFQMRIVRMLILGIHSGLVWFSAEVPLCTFAWPRFPLA